VADSAEASRLARLRGVKLRTYGAPRPCCRYLTTPYSCALDALTDKACDIICSGFRNLDCEISLAIP